MDCSMPESSIHGILQGQDPLFMGFSRQEYCSGLPCPAPGYLPNPGIKPTSSALARGFFTTSTTWEVPHVLIISAKGNNQTKLSLDTGLPPSHWVLAGRRRFWAAAHSRRGQMRVQSRQPRQPSLTVCYPSALPITRQLSGVDRPEVMFDN